MSSIQAHFFYNQNRILLKIISNNKRTLMEAGANAAAVPIRDKQKAVFMVSIDSDVGGVSSNLLVKKHNTSNLPKGYLQVRICTFLLSLPIILLSTVFEKI